MFIPVAFVRLSGRLNPFAAQSTPDSISIGMSFSENARSECRALSACMTVTPESLSGGGNLMTSPNAETHNPTANANTGIIQFFTPRPAFI